MYSSETVNFGLPQFTPDDKMDCVSDFNPAFTTIDRVMQENKTTAYDAVNAVDASVQAANESKVNAQRAANSAAAAVGSAQVAQNKAEAAALSAEQANNETAALNTRLDTVQTNLDNFENSQNEVNTAVNEKIADNATAIADVDEYVKNLDQNVKANKEDITILYENDMAALQKITKNQEDIESLRDQSLQLIYTYSYVGTDTLDQEQINTDVPTSSYSTNSIYIAEVKISRRSGTSYIGQETQTFMFSLYSTTSTTRAATLVTMSAINTPAYIIVNTLSNEDSNIAIKLISYTNGQQLRVNGLRLFRVRFDKEV